MTLKIEVFPGPPLGTNAYLVADTDTSEALVVDAPKEVTTAIQQRAEEAGWRIGQVFITHTHWDHIGDAREMQQTWGAPLLAHPDAAAALANPASMVMTIPFEIPPVTPDQFVNEGDTVRLGSHTFTVLHLPGHEEHHIALYSEADQVLLSGDVLFPNGHGRTDIPGSDQAVMNATLQRLLALPAAVTVYPGHGDPTTIGAEAGWMRQNPG